MRPKNALIKGMFSSCKIETGLHDEVRVAFYYFATVTSSYFERYRKIIINLALGIDVYKLV